MKHKRHVKTKYKKDFSNWDLFAVLVQLYWRSFLNVFDVKDHRDLPPALEMCRAG